MKLRQPSLTVRLGFVVAGAAAAAGMGSGSSIAQSCVEPECIPSPACTTDADCPQDMRCWEQTRCVAIWALTCDSEADCAPGFVCPQPGWTACFVEMEHCDCDADCPGRTLCRIVDGGHCDEGLDCVNNQRQVQRCITPWVEGDIPMGKLPGRPVGGDMADAAASCGQPVPEAGPEPEPEPEPASASETGSAGCSIAQGAGDWTALQFWFVLLPLALGRRRMSTRRRIRAARAALTPSASPACRRSRCAPCGCGLRRSGPWAAPRRARAEAGRRRTAASPRR